MTLDVVQRSPFWRNILTNAGGHTVGAAIQFGLILVLPRLISIDAFAGYITALAVIAVGEMASDFGARIWATRRFALGEPAAETLLMSFLTKLAFSVVFSIGALALPFSTLTELQVLIVLLIAMLQPSTDPIMWFLRGRERLDIEAATVLSWRAICAVTLVAVAYMGGSLTMMLFGWLAWSVVRIVVEVRYRAVKPLFEGLSVAWREVTRTALLETAKECAPLGAAFVLMSLFQRIGVLLLGELGTVHDVANYGLAFSLAASAGFVATSVTVSSFPALARRVAAGDIAGAEAIARRKLKLVSALVLPICILGIVAAPFVIGLAYPKSYWPAAEILIWLMPGLYISCLNFALKYLLNALGLNWRDAATAIIGIVAFPVVAFVPAWPMLAPGAAFAWTAAETLIFIGKAAILWRDGRLPLKRIWLYAAVSVVFLVVTVAISGPLLRIAAGMIGR